MLGEVLAEVSPAEGHTDTAEQRHEQHEPPELDFFHCRHSLAGNAGRGTLMCVIRCLENTSLPARFHADEHRLG
jgi:hypothetical protein